MMNMNGDVHEPKASGRICVDFADVNSVYLYINRSESFIEDFAKALNPAQYLKENLDLLTELIPEFKACIGFDQHNPYHYQTVDEHTYTVLNSVGDDLEIRLAALLHDISKPLCFSIKKKDPLHYSFYGHDIASSNMARIILNRFGLNKEAIERICKYILNHQKVYSQKSNFDIIEDFDGFIKFLKADIEAHLNPNLEKLNSYIELYKKEVYSDD